MYIVYNIVLGETFLVEKPYKVYYKYNIIYINIFPKREKKYI